jgi:hypothetical protein
LDVGRGAAPLHLVDEVPVTVYREPYPRLPPARA